MMTPFVMDDLQSPLVLWPLYRGLRQSGRTSYADRRFDWPLTTNRIKFLSSGRYAFCGQHLGYDRDNQRP